MQGKLKYNLLGKEFGGLKVLSRAINDKNNHTKWNVKCLVCEKEFVINSGALLNRKVSGGCQKCSAPKGCNRSYYKGTKNIAGNWFSRVMYQAKIRNHVFNITIEYIQELLEKQNFKCAISGKEISMDPTKFGSKQTKEVRTGSLDRINSQIGYIPGNVQWVHKEVNLMKWKLDQKIFLEWCRVITEYKKGYNG